MKSKKVLTILLSLAIMFTFMPAMAFAASDTTYYPSKVTWSDDYSTATVTVKDVSAVSGTYSTTRTYSDGVIEVSIDTSGKDWSFEASDDVAVTTSYYDLTVASFATADGTVLKSEYLNGNYTTPTYVKLTVPSYVSNASGAEAVYKTIDAISNEYETLSVKESIDVEGDSTVDQTFDVSMTASYDAKKDEPTEGIIYGLVPTATVLVHKRATEARDVVFYFDDDEENCISSGALETVYDGADHVLTSNTVENYSVKYYQFNSSGKWESVSAVTVNDVADPVYVKAEIWKDGASSAADTRTLTVATTYCGQAYFAFDTDGNYGTDKWYVNEGDTIDGTSYIVVAPSSANKNTPDETKAAITANKTEIMSYFNDYYEITESVAKSDPYTVTLTMSKKTNLTDDEIEALEEKYETLTTNFKGFGLGDNTDTTVYIIPESKDNEVTFTKAVSSKVYKGSKTTKKGKLKKNQTIQFTAETESGATIAYKLINVNTSKITIDKSTGLVTVKKGLKKGTYKFQVKAYVANTDYYETQNVTIKVKK